jgi:hypothetical protein
LDGSEVRAPGELSHAVGLILWRTGLLDVRKPQHSGKQKYWAEDCRGWCWVEGELNREGKIVFFFSFLNLDPLDLCLLSS